MNNCNIKSIINKYRLSIVGVGVVFAAITILLLYLTDNYFLYYLSLLVSVLLIKKFGVIFYNKFFNSVLTTELNLPKYKDLIETGKIVSNSLIEHLYIAYYSGDYNKAINICNMKLEDKKFEKFKIFYLLILARCYFEMGDLENLGKVNEMFKNYVATHKNGNKIKEKFVYFKFIEFYLLGDFKAAEELYEKLYLTQKEKSGTLNLNDVSVRFTYAICCYKCGDFVKATELFNDVIAIAPSFNYAEISKRYLGTIENNTEYTLEQIKLAAKMVNIPVPKSRNIAKIIYAIAFLVIIIGLISSALGYNLLLK